MNSLYIIHGEVESKGKGNPITGPGGPIGWVEVWLNFFLTSALEGGVWSASQPVCLYPPERPGTYCTGGWEEVESTRREMVLACFKTPCVCLGGGNIRESGEHF